MGAAAPVCPIEQKAKEQHGPADHRDRAHSGVQPGEVKQQARQDNRNGCNQQQEGQPRSGMIEASKQEVRQAEQAGFHLCPEVKDNSRQRADMNGDVDRLALGPEDP